MRGTGPQPHTWSCYKTEWQNLLGVPVDQIRITRCGATWLRQPVAPPPRLPYKKRPRRGKVR